MSETKEGEAVKKQKLLETRKGKPFGQKLADLAEERNMHSAADIAAALYENDLCFELVHPRDRDVKYLVSKDKDINTITRRVQEHISPSKEAQSVPGNYVFAYSILFDCSMDYLYGKIEEKCPDVEVLDISKKTGLSVEAVKRLMENDEISLDEYLEEANNYGLFDDPECGTYDPELEDYFLDTDASVPKFWSSLIESDLYEKLPENWYRMACALYTSKAVKMVAEEAEKKWDDLPPLDIFLSWVSTWENFHPERPVARLHNMTWEEAYEKEPEFIKQVYREIRYEHLYSSVDRAENYETVYWGCAGKIDRNALDYFHKKAEDWCSTGPLPDFWKDADCQ